MVRIKICGITSPEDAAAAAAAGADAIGMVFAESPRRVDAASGSEIVASLPPFVIPVAVFVDEDSRRIIELCRDAGIGTVQLSGREPAGDISVLKEAGLLVVKAVHVTPAGETGEEEHSGADAVVLDTRTDGRMGGTGVPFDLMHVRSLRFDVPVILAGGLTPDNVAERVNAIQPYAVDVSSGVERSVGKKDGDLVIKFIENATRAAEVP